MSKQRARARAARRVESARRAAAEQERQARAAAIRARQDRRAAVWRRSRLWTHGPSFRRNKEKWAALGTLLLVLAVTTFLITDSVGAVLLVGLVSLIAAPAAVALIFDRRGPG